MAEKGKGVGVVVKKERKKERKKKRRHTVIWTIIEVEFLRFFFGKQTVMGTKPGSILGICTGVIGETT